MNTPGTPAEINYLDQAKSTLMAALALHGVETIKAKVIADGGGFRHLTEVAALKSDGTQVDLTITTPITAIRDGQAVTFDSLHTFARDYLSEEINQRPAPFSTNGELTFHADWGGLSQPIDWERRWKHEAEEKQKILRDAKAPILKALASLGVAKVVIAYDGEGDSGQVNDITATTDKDAEVSLDAPYLETTLHEALDDLAWDCLTAYHVGFENNEGGEGDITINVADGVITIDHNDRIVQLSNTTTEV